MATKAMSWFRKHQKMILAIVTIGTMLIFIVGDAVQAMNQGGGRSGGIVSWLKNLFTGGEKEDTVVRIAGKNYSAEQLAQLQNQRLFAIDVMNGVASNGNQRFLENLGFKEEDFKDRNKVQQKLMEMEQKDPTIRSAQANRDNSLLNKINPSITTFNQLANMHEIPESVSEFLLMRNKANELGITITNSTVQEELLRLGMGRVTIDEINTLVRTNARARGMMSIAKLDSVLGILADEIRVSIAKQVISEDLSKTILQSAYARQGMPFSGASKPQITPADLWKHYVDIKTSLSTGILPIKVEDYLSRVAEPTAAEKQDFFDKYKKDYPSSEKDTPGFKIPPMYRVGFVFADMKDNAPARKHYQAVVDGWDTLMPFTALGELADAYEAKKKTNIYRTLKPFIEFAVAKAAGSPWVRVYVWQGQQDHAHLASILGHFALGNLQVGTFNPGNAFAMSLTGETVPADRHVAIDLANRIAGAHSLLGTLFPALNVRSGNVEVNTPFNVVANALIEQRYLNKARFYLSNDFDELTTNLADYSKRYNEWRGKVLRKLLPPGEPPFYKEETKLKLSDYLAQFTKPRGLTYYETKDLRSRDDLLVEPGERLLNTFIKPLYVEPIEMPTRYSARQFEDYVKGLLVGNELAAGGTKPKLFEATSTRLRDERNKNKEVALHWIAEASEPRVPELKEVDAAITKAWKMEKARVIAKDEADKIAKDVGQADNFRKLADMKGYAPGQTIANYSEPELSSTSPFPMYMRCPVPKVVDNEPNDFVKQCLDKLKTKGDTVVIPDKSKSVYYLVYLSNRSEPKTSNPLDVEAFHNEVIRPSMSRQLLIEGNTFRNYVEQTQQTAETVSWRDYLRALTGLTDEKSKLYFEVISRNR